MLEIRPGATIVDATLGGAGHTREIAKKIGESGRIFAFDADHEAIARAQALATEDARIHLIQANFRALKEKLQGEGVDRIDGALFDLGWSGYQLSAGRGFSFLSEEALSMAYDTDQAFNASIIVNTWEESSLTDVIRGWGEERYAPRIARAIVAAREQKKIDTANELAEIIKAAVPSVYRFGRIHPATKTFQALRIAVNDELGALVDGIKAAWEMLAPGGRLAVITFHSIEDRIVKRQFRAWEDAGEAERVTKKPLTPSPEEVQENPRSRSAKLRIVQKNPYKL